MADEYEEIAEAIRKGIMSAWDWAIIEDEGHEVAGRHMAHSALKCLEDSGFKVVRANDA